MKSNHYRGKNSSRNTPRGGVRLPQGRLGHNTRSRYEKKYKKIAIILHRDSPARRQGESASLAFPYFIRCAQDAA
jgi:hypothetical protein